MLDFASVRRKEMTLDELVKDLAVDDLRDLTNEMIDDMLVRMDGCTDADVTFLPVDPAAKDTYATNPEEVDLAWTLGHVIVHATASAEESAALAAELARGVALEPRRSRSEVPWRTVTTLAQCRHRLEESRRMRLASLEMWPDVPHVDNTYSPRFGWEINAYGRFVLGLLHDFDHLGQISEIVRQARAARSEREPVI